MKRIIRKRRVANELKGRTGKGEGRKLSEYNMIREVKLVQGKWRTEEKGCKGYEG